MAHVLQIARTQPQAIQQPKSSGLEAADTRGQHRLSLINELAPLEHIARVLWPEDRGAGLQA